MSLFARFDALPDAAVAVRALAGWADAFDDDCLTRHATDKRPAVATAAKALLAARRGR